jgi:CheY-like chemotaxis protein
LEGRVIGGEGEGEGESARIEFSVTDTGPGIAADKMHLLFKPFSQTDSSTTREYGGSGLGLSIVRNLALALGGEVGVDSTPDSGSRFWFQVPVKIVHEGQDSRLAKPVDVAEVPAAPDTEGLHGNILVAEDHPINCMVVKTLLGRLGLQASIVTDGQQAVHAVKTADPQNRPELILMDLHMPVMDGYTATQEIRRWEAEHGVPRVTIVALTADAFEEDRQRCLSAGMDDFMTKPLAIGALKSMLLRWLPQAQARPATGAAPDASAMPPDREKLAALVNEILPLLVHNEFKAIGKMREIQSVVAGTALETEINAVSALLQTFRFDLALTHLRRLMGLPDE